jgi:hypothetical protein
MRCLPVRRPTIDAQMDAAQRRSSPMPITLQQMGDDVGHGPPRRSRATIEKAIATMNDTTSMTQTQINANIALMTSYMSALTNLANNPDIPADARNQYMAELLRVSQSTQGLVNALSGTEVTWPTTPGTTPPPTGTPSPTPTPTPTSTYTGPTKAEINAMKNDGTPGNYAAARAAWNAAHPDDQM